MRGKYSVTLVSITAISLSLLLSACSNDKQGAEALPKPTAAAEQTVDQAKNLAESKPQLATQGGNAAEDNAAIESLYQKTCLSCHLSGAAGAPRTHDVDAWAPRMAKGMDTMVANIKNGLNAMPPKGLCFDCTDEQYVELVKFMAGPKPQ